MSERAAAQDHAVLHHAAPFQSPPEAAPHLFPLYRLQRRRANPVAGSGLQSARRTTLFPSVAEARCCCPSPRPMPPGNGTVQASIWGFAAERPGAVQQRAGKVQQPLPQAVGVRRCHVAGDWGGFASTRAALGVRAWRDDDGERPPLRAALTGRSPPSMAACRRTASRRVRQAGSSGWPVSSASSGAISVKWLSAPPERRMLAALAALLLLQQSAAGAREHRAGGPGVHAYLHQPVRSRDTSSLSPADLPKAGNHENTKAGDQVSPAARARTQSYAFTSRFDSKRLRPWPIGDDTGNRAQRGGPCGRLAGQPSGPMQGLSASVSHKARAFLELADSAGFPAPKHWAKGLQVCSYRSVGPVVTPFETLIFIALK